MFVFLKLARFRKHFSDELLLIFALLSIYKISKPRHVEIYEEFTGGKGLSLNLGKVKYDGTAIS